MAIRVRKLARRLGRSPADLLGVLQAIGVRRYRSPEDMLPDKVERKLLSALKDGVRPVPVEPVAVRQVSEPSPQRPVATGIFAGVRRQRDPRFETMEHAPNRPHSAPSDETMAGEGPARAVRVPGEPADASTLHDALRAEREALRAEREALRAEREALVAAREALAAEREALAAERARLEALERPGVTPLQEVLEERGLKGADESERAIRALAESRRVAEILPYLRVEDAAGLHRYLSDVLVLVDGKPPEGVRGALVAVAPERSEVPGAAEWRRLTSRVSEALLLNGARRVLIVGGPIRMHRLLADAFDPRIEVRFRPAQRVYATDAEADLAQVDALVLWRVEEAPEARTIYDRGRVHVARVSRPSVRDLLQGWARQLTDG